MNETSMENIKVEEGRFSKTSSENYLSIVTIKAPHSVRNTLSLPLTNGESVEKYPNENMKTISIFSRFSRVKNKSVKI